MAMLDTPRSVWTDPLHFCAFGFASGTMPFAPGTWGTLMALPFYAVSHAWPWPLYLLGLILSFVLGIWLCQRTAQDLGVHDHPGIVWDEMVGYWLTLFMIPYSWTAIILAFVLFRFFDIYKPWPIGWLDRKVQGGLGIMLDDIIAAVYANLVLQVCCYFKLLT